MNQDATNSVSQTTIQQTFLRLGLRSRRLVHAPVLTAVHRQRRLAFAHEYHNWTFTERQQVAFSNESCFMLHRTDERYMRHETSDSKHPATIAGMIQDHYDLENIFLEFSGFTHHCERHDGSIKICICVLSDHVQPFMRIDFSTG
ncbi:transposable element Tcb1 transposase [Trichonephila clavipes]|nr:transposable element Tcb1 transposase [Trichonephila clavipes]